MGPKARKVALISGVTGQDGAYLSELLLAKGYEVHGIKRRSSQFNTKRVDHLFQRQAGGTPFFLHHGDLTDSTSLVRLIQTVQPDEIYNLAAQSHVMVSFESPEYTANADAVGPLRLLEAIRILGMEKKIRFYQASTSEMFGNIGVVPQRESTPFYPRSPYGVAKLFGHWITVNYREAYGIHATSGILFNHESPLRGETFVTRKITRAVARIALGMEECLEVGNLEAKRDWGHARDYVEGMWRIMQHPTAEEFVLATNQATTVRAFLIMAFRHAGIELGFKGKGADEVGFCKRTKAVRVRIDSRYVRPTEVDFLQGDYAKAKAKLGWEPSVSVEELCQEMVEADLYRVKQRAGMIPKDSPAVEEVCHEPGGFLSWLKRTNSAA